MEYEDNEQSQGGLLERIKESPRTVSALIIILIVAAAIYAFSGGNQQDTSELATADEGEIASQAEDNQSGSGEEAAAGEDEESMNETDENTGAGDEDSAANEESQQEMDLPEAEETDEGYREVAQPGDGITHLARRATNKYLNENDPGYEITAEHRVYIEDYIQDNVGSDGLAIGEQRMISFDLIEAAVNAAGELNERQLQNLSKYTSSA